jgi:hypothetical protein
MPVREYPYVASCLSGTVVRFTSPGKGFVIKNARPGTSFTDQYKIGDCLDGWNEEAFSLISQGEYNMQNLKKDDIIIGSQLKSTNMISFAKEPKVQANIIIAQQEAVRLAKLDPDKKFVVVKVMGVASVPTPGVHWE